MHNLRKKSQIQFGSPTLFEKFQEFLKCAPYKQKSKLMNQIVTVRSIQFPIFRDGNKHFERMGAFYKKCEV